MHHHVYIFPKELTEEYILKYVLDTILQLRQEFTCYKIINQKSTDNTVHRRVYGLALSPLHVVSLYISECYFLF